MPLYTPAFCDTSSSAIRAISSLPQRFVVTVRDNEYIDSELALSIRLAALVRYSYSHSVQEQEQLQAMPH